MGWGCKGIQGAIFKGTPKFNSVHALPFVCCGTNSLRTCKPFSHIISCYKYVLSRKCHLLIISAAYIQMHSRILLQTLGTPKIREQSDLDPYCTKVHKQKRVTTTQVPT